MISYEDIDLNLMRLNDLELELIENNKTFVSKIKYNGQNFDMKTSLLKLVDIKKENDICMIEVEFLSKFSDFYELIYDIDDFVLNQILSKSNKWFGAEKMNPETIENLFKRTLQLPNKLSRNPTMKLIVDKKIDVKDGIKNSEIRLILNLDKIIFYPNMYLLNYNVIELEIVDDSCEKLFSDDSRQSYTSDSESIYSTE